MSGMLARYHVLQNKSNKCQGLDKTLNDKCQGLDKTLNDKCILLITNTIVNIPWPNLNIKEKTNYKSLEIG